MATVTGYTSARMKAIEDNAIVDGAVVGDNLILTTFDDTDIDAGNVRGPQGDQGVQGPIGEVSTAQMTTAISDAVTGLPRELMDYTPRTSNNGPFTTLTTLNGLTKTVFTKDYAGEPRHVELGAKLNFSSSVAGDYVAVYMKVEGNEEDYRLLHLPLANTVFTVMLHHIMTISDSASVLIQAERHSGSGNITNNGTATRPSTLWAIDLGEDTSQGP